MNLYNPRCALAAWILGTTTASIEKYIGHFDSRQMPGAIPMLCGNCGDPIPLGQEAWAGPIDENVRVARCVGCADV